MVNTWRVMSRDQQVRHSRRSNRFQFLSESDALVVMGSSLDDCTEALEARIEDYSAKELKDKCYFYEEWAEGRWRYRDDIPPNTLLKMLAKAQQEIAGGSRIAI